MAGSGRAYVCIDATTMFQAHTSPRITFLGTQYHDV